LPVHEPHRIVCHLGELLEERGMTLTALAEAVGVSLVNLSIMKNNRAKAIRYSTLTAICQVLDCQPGDVLSVEALETAPSPGLPWNRTHNP
jgi:putative transcriptional regulator